MTGEVDSAGGRLREAAAMSSGTAGALGMVNDADAAPVGGGAVGAALRRNFGSFRSGLKICVFSEGGEEGFSRAASTLAARAVALDGRTFRSIGRTDCAAGFAFVPAGGLAVATVFAVVAVGRLLAASLAVTAVRLAVDSLRFEVGTDLAVMSMRGGAVINRLGPSALDSDLPDAFGDVAGAGLPNALGDAAGAGLPNALGDAAGAGLPNALGDAAGDDLLDAPTDGGLAKVLAAAKGADFSNALGEAAGDDFAAGRGGGGMKGRLALPSVDKVPAPIIPTPERCGGFEEAAAVGSCARTDSGGSKSLVVTSRVTSSGKSSVMSLDMAGHVAAGGRCERDISTHLECMVSRRCRKLHADAYSSKVLLWQRDAAIQWLNRSRRILPSRTVQSTCAGCCTIGASLHDLCRQSWCRGSPTTVATPTAIAATV